MPLLLFAHLNSYLAEKSGFFGVFFGKNESQRSTTNPAKQLNKLDFFFFFVLNSGWTVLEKKKLNLPSEWLPGEHDQSMRRPQRKQGSFGTKRSELMVIAGNSVTARQHLPVWEGGENNCGESALALARAWAAPRCQRSPTFAIIGSAAPNLDWRNNGINLTEEGFFF